MLDKALKNGYLALPIFTELSVRMASDPDPDRQLRELEKLRSRVGGRPVVFFDGTCAMCAKTVLFVHNRDKEAAFRFAPLESGVFKVVLEAFPSLAGVDSIVFLEFGAENASKISVRSDAVIQILKKLGFFWKTLAFLGQLVPRPIRDVTYRFVAARRYAILGRNASASCPLPPRELADKLIS